MLDSIVIGGGQAGLATGWHLRNAGLTFTILEACDGVGGSWPHYYDSLRLFSPVAYSSLPGLPLPGSPDAYPLRDDVVRYLQAYAQRWDLPVRTRNRVLRVSRSGAAFEVEIQGGERLATRSVIAATGSFSRPHRPDLSGLDGFKGQVLHSANYRSAASVEGRRVVVVGGANSAVQIAVELSEHKRVSLATRRPIRFVPQRVLGRDFHFWLRWSGLDRTRWLSDESTPVLDDGRCRQAVRAGRPDRRRMFKRATPDGVTWSDGKEERIDAIVLATGYRPNLDFLAPLVPIDQHRRVRQRAGIADTEGLYYVGLPRQRNFASATLRGVGPDAGHVVNHLLRWLSDGRH
ncbi:NAD(P)-binding domain-containing protein [Aquabacterium sp.]|uniref:NAD(P)-binding domain-containing protein n=1 Tax=Aquabacterium sp. TaxID=1872578 RepID=UPI002C4EC749|nr:NAD(P)-binding domain-containing protein [Aquabacterium sp.]HSW08004.1 NAD(P)-binding domain-containing protein [Aquabacterium sp.]